MGGAVEFVFVLEFPDASDTAIGKLYFMDCLLESSPHTGLYGKFVVTLTIIHTFFCSNYDN